MKRKNRNRRTKDSDIARLTHHCRELDKELFEAHRIIRGVWAQIRYTSLRLRDSIHMPGFDYSKLLTEHLDRSIHALKTGYWMKPLDFKDEDYDRMEEKL